MHGRVKIRTSAEEAARKKKEQDLKVKAYRAAMAKIFEKRQKDELDEEMLGITGQVLGKNPDVYTLWNIRKECILKIQETNEDNEYIQKLHDKDLGFTEQCLMVNPKSYYAWHHRVWILENCPSPNWDHEVMLCVKYLKLDERNFHCWDYRRYVVSKAGVAPEKELDFCTEKIRNNFSNYSSWHYRSKLLPLLYPHESDPLRPISEEKLKEELEMVLTAAFTDPNDSSAWFYQRWLLGYSEPALDIAAFRSSSNLTVIAFTKPVDIKTLKISCNVKDVDFEGINWVSSSTHQFSKVWTSTAKLNWPSKTTDSIVLSCTAADGQIFNLDLKEMEENQVYGVKCCKFQYEFGKGVLDELQNQLNSCNQLLEYEPDSKWTLLTAALLMKAIDGVKYHDQCLTHLNKLEKVDSLRKGYYQDLASKWIVENYLRVWINEKPFVLDADLSSLNLSSTFYEEYFSIADKVVLAHNQIKPRSLPKFSAFQFCVQIDLRGNHLANLDKAPKNLSRLQSILH